MDPSKLQKLTAPHVATLVLAIQRAQDLFSMAVAESARVRNARIENAESSYQYAIGEGDRKTLKAIDETEWSAPNTRALLLESRIKHLAHVRKVREDLYAAAWHDNTQECIAYAASRQAEVQAAVSEFNTALAEALEAGE